VTASSARVYAHVLIRAGHTAQAVALVRHTADQFAGAYDRRPARELSALGLMLLRGANAAATAGDRNSVGELLAEAREICRYVDTDRPDAWANFSLTNVELHTVSTYVTLGEPGQALTTARPLAQRRIPVPERRAALWVDTARALTQQNRLVAGLHALKFAASCAPEDVRRPAIRTLVADMAERDRAGRLPELRTLDWTTS
jgi:hypothetical protein